MMHGATDYALARVHARAAGGMRGEDWRRIGNARGTAAVLALLRSSNAGPWVAGLTSGDDPHQIEASLRERFRERVREIARWADPRWHAALRGCEGLVEPPGQQAAIADPVSAWLAELRPRMPAMTCDDHNEFRWLVQTLEDHLHRFAGLAAGNGWHLREELQRRLTGRMGRNRLSPAHLLTAVALLWLEHERVRGELLRWSALPGVPA